MQRISRAPELSATLSLDSCWITRQTSLRLLENLDQPPALGAGERTRLHDADEIALAGLVARIVGVEGARPAHDLLVLRVAPCDLDLDGDRLVRLARYDPSLPDLAAGRAALRRRRAGARALALAAPLGAVRGPPRRGAPACLAASGRPLLGGLPGTLLAGLAGALEAPARLPVEAFQDIVPAFIGRFHGFAIGGSLLGFGGLLIRSFGGRLACGGFNLLSRFLRSLLNRGLLDLRLLRRSLFGALLRS